MTASTKKTSSFSLTKAEVDPADSAMTVASWQAKLREAIFNAVTEADVAEIVKKQIDLAKQGDKSAIKFVMDYVLGAGTGGQPMKLVQQNFYDAESAARAYKTGRTSHLNDGD